MTAKVDSTANFNRLCDFMGYGDIEKTRLVFVGIEEHGTWDDIAVWSDGRAAAALDAMAEYVPRSGWDHVDALWKNPDGAWRERDPKSLTVRSHMKLAWRLSSEVFGAPPRHPDAMAYYIDSNVNHLEFHANLYPLAAPSQMDEPAGKNELEVLRTYVAIPDVCKEEYYNLVCDRRLGVLAKLRAKISRESGQQPIVFVTAKGGVWDGSPRGDKIVRSLCGGSMPEPRGNMMCSPDGLVWFCYHPRYLRAWRDRSISKMVEAVKNRWPSGRTDC